MGPCTVVAWVRSIERCEGEVPGQTVTIATRRPVRSLQRWRMSFRQGIYSPMTVARTLAENGGAGVHSQTKLALDSSKFISTVTPTLVLRMWIVLMGGVEMGWPGGSGGIFHRGAECIS